MIEPALLFEAASCLRGPAADMLLVASFVPPHGIAFEEARHAAFKVGRARFPELYFWSQAQCVVTTQPLARRAAFAWASDRSQARGWPVTVRRSGGGTVFHGSDVLCVSLMERLSTANIDRAYGRLCRLLRAGLRELGVDAQIGSMPSAPCDGRFNLMVGGRKVAGTAARMSLAGDGVSALLHASLVIGGDPSGGVEAIKRFESDLGIGSAYAPASMTSLSEHAGALSADQVAAAIRRAYFRIQQEDNR